MPSMRSRRQFLAGLGAAAAGVTLAPDALFGDAATASADRPGPGVAVARDQALTRGPLEQHRDLLHRLLDAAVQKVTGASDAKTAWKQLFSPDDRIGIKVNTLGLSTQPAVVDAIVAALRAAGLPADNIIVWDRFDVELSQAGFRLNKSRAGVRCRGTDAERIGTGYQQQIQTSGRIGSCFSRIVAERTSALISVPVLKDHNLAGASLGMKNFYGAIHNPNKYHDHNCDPYVADVVGHRFIAPKWKLTVVDGTRAQYHAGPARHPGFAWAFGGLIVGSDFVATDAVAADLLDQQRQAQGLKSLTEDDRPPRYIATAAARGLGVADLSKIQRIEV